MRYGEKALRVTPQLLWRAGTEGACTGTRPDWIARTPRLSPNSQPDHSCPGPNLVRFNLIHLGIHVNDVSAFVVLSPPQAREQAADLTVFWHTFVEAIAVAAQCHSWRWR